MESKEKNYDGQENRVMIQEQKEPVLAQRQQEHQEQSEQQARQERQSQQMQEGQSQQTQEGEGQQTQQGMQGQKAGGPVPPAASTYGTWPTYLQGQPSYSAMGGVSGQAGQGMVPTTGPQTPPYPPLVRPKVLNAYEEQLKSGFERYGLCALFIGVLTAFCFYRNANAITYPLFIALVYLVAYRILPELGFPVKRDSHFLALAALILAVNSAYTASPTLHCLNHLAQMLLGTIFLIHQGYEDKSWDIEKYISSMFLFWFQVLASLPVPFSYTTALLKKVKQGRNRNIFLLLGGFLAGLPAVVYLGYLLADADVVFKMLIEEIVLDNLNLSTLFSIALIISCSAIAVCCLMGSLASMSVPPQKEINRHNPLAAISFTAMIALLYVFFCAIQVVYLFAGKGRLPEEMTYSEYARQGFFQLLAVVVLNLIFVLNCFKYFHKHRVLTSLLTLISLCTYVMIASAVYRMLLYVGAYYLTFLRLFVLWFLGVLAILMLGVLISIFKAGFPLFRWCLTVITAAYCGFVWCLPDYQIARYNIAQEGGWVTPDNVEYFTDYLSADAAPVLAKAPLSPEVTYSKLYNCENIPESKVPVDKVLLISSLDGIPWYYREVNSNRLNTVGEQIEVNLQAARSWQPGIRSYNFSEARAKKMVDMVDAGKSSLN